MKTHNLEWSGADVKFVEALLLATGGEGSAILQDILLMNDALSGTVLSLPELEQALGKLIAADCLHVQKNKFSLSDVFLSEYERAASAVPDISDHEKIEELLKCHELTEAKLEEARAQLKQYKLKNHYQQYQEQFG